MAIPTVCDERRAVCRRVSQHYLSCTKPSLRPNYKRQLFGTSAIREKHVVFDIGILC